MNEEEIIKNIKEMIQWSDHNTYKIALRGILDLYNKEKEKNKNAIDFINERKKTVDKDMAEGTRLQVGTFMWQVDDLLEILEE